MITGQTHAFNFGDLLIWLIDLNTIYTIHQTSFTFRLINFRLSLNRFFVNQL